MSLPKICQLNDVGDGSIRCSGRTVAPLLYDLEPITVGPVLIPATGPAGRTSFNVTFDNNAEPAISPTRYTELQATLTDYLTDLASQLGPQRDTSLAANAITVNTHISFDSITTSYVMTLEYKTALSPNIPPGMYWVITITKANSAGVFVKEIPLNYTNPNQPNINLATMINSSNRNLAFQSGFISTLVNFPTGPFVCPSTCEFTWNWNPPMGSTATLSGGGMVLFKDGYVIGPGFQPAENAKFYANPVPNWINSAAPSADIGTFILAQAGPNGAYVFPQASNIQTTNPGLWDHTGPALPTPTTPIPQVSGFNNGTSPMILASQWRFMRIYPQFAPYKATIDAALAGNTYDLELFINTDFNRLLVSQNFYYFPDTPNYSTPNPALYVFKSVLVHEIFHGLGCIQGVWGQQDATTYATPQFNHYLFDNANKPNNSGQFLINQRSFGTGDWISNGSTINAPINPSSPSHLASNFGANGLMEATLFQGSSPTMGPSQFDWDTLLVGQVVNDTQAICVSGETLVQTSDGPIQIQDLASGTLILGPLGDYQEVKAVVKLASWEKFVVIPAEALGKGIPTQQLRIRPGHPILLGGNEVLPETLIGCGCCNPVHFEIDARQKQSVYTIVTERRGFVMMQGIPVATWGEDAWQNFKQNDFGFRFNASEQ